MVKLDLKRSGWPTLLAFFLHQFLVPPSIPFRHLVGWVGLYGFRWPDCAGPPPFSVWELLLGLAGLALSLFGEHPWV